MALKKLLSIDGGGVRGLAAIVVLEMIMGAANEGRRKNNLPPQEPWEMFDMIGGTSTGGLIAIMLGRLHMSLQECKEAYMTLSMKAFSERHILARAAGFAGLGPKFETKPLEEAIMEVLNKAREHLGVSPADALLKEDDAACKVFVVSHLQNISDQTAILRSYDNFEKPPQSINTMKIWQACRATSAATTFYEPLIIDGTRYSDGGLLYNNPVSHVHAEGSEMFRDDETLLISLGTGIASDKEYNPHLFTITNQLVGLATRTQGEADTFIRREGGKAARAKRYFRFDIPGIGDIGLEEADKLLQIKLASEKFLNNPEVGMKVTSCSEQLARGLDLGTPSNSEICQSLGPYAANPRQDTIPLAHPNSFQWIWDDAKHNFVPWLKSGSGIFWIFGKPASGKSTLMKFLLRHNSTNEHLNSQGGQYSMCQYFFHELSELDTRQESSIAGLLHGILFQLLQLFPELIRTIRPMYRKKVHPHKAPGSLTSIWTIENLKEALMSLATQSSVSQKVCLFIDGFDECQGERGNYLDFLKSWLQKMIGNGLSVKICLSSRDIPAMRERLDTHQSLELHLFTRKDITNFVSQELLKTKSKSISLDSHGHELITRNLIKSVVDKAQGVFVWVKLVVADLVSGLEAAEDEEDLEVRLQSLPPELEDLYAHIISRIPCRDLHTAFKYFQLLLRAPGKTCTLTLLQFLMAAQNPKKCLQNLDEPGLIETSPEEILEKLASLKDHLRDRCGNLIQVQTRRNAPRRWEPTRRENVTFIHLSFKEYISRDSVQQGIKDRIQPWGMPLVPTADLLLMASCLLLLKTQKCYIPHWTDVKYINNNQHEKGVPRSPKSEILGRLQTPTLDGEVENEDDEEEYTEEICRRAPDNLIAKFFNYAENLEQFFKNAETCTCYIDELDRFLTKADQRWASKFYIWRTLHDIPQPDVLCLAVCWKLKYYVKKKIKERQHRKKRQPPLLFYAMNPPGWAHEEVDLDLFEILLKAGAKPNESYNYNGIRKTTWEHTLQHFLRIGSARPLQEWQKVIELMLNYGANPNQNIYLRDRRRYTTVLHLLVDQYGKVDQDRKNEARDAFLMLLDHGAKGEVENSDHISAFDYAKNECTTIANAICNSGNVLVDNEGSSHGIAEGSNVHTPKPPQRHRRKTAEPGSKLFKRRYSAVEDEKSEPLAGRHHEHRPPREESDEIPKHHVPLPTRHSKRHKKDGKGGSQGFK